MLRHTSRFIFHLHLLGKPPPPASNHVGICISVETCLVYTTPSNLDELLSLKMDFLFFQQTSTPRIHGLTLVTLGDFIRHDPSCDTVVPTYTYQFKKW